MNKISLALIVKNDKRSFEHAVEAIKSVEQYVDEVVIDINDPDPDKIEFPKEFERYNVTANKWEQDFSKARNANFARCSGDWILWMDADDVLVGAKNLRELTEIADEQDISGYYMMYHYQFDTKGNTTEKHWKLQFIKNDGHGEWKARIHEDYLPKTQVKYNRAKDVSRLHVHGEEMAEDKMKRNLEILTEELKEQGDNPDPRTIIYTAKTLIALGDKVTPYPMLLKYLELSGWDEERYEARLLLAEITRGSKEEREHLKEAMFIKPEYPDAYYEMAESYMKDEKWSRAIEYFNTGFSKKIPEDQVTTFMDRITWRPLGMYAYALLNIGRFDEAEKAALASLKLGGDQNVSSLLETIRHIKNKDRIAKAFSTVAGELEAIGEIDKIKVLLSSVPTHLKDHARILSLQFNYMPPRKWNKDEIAIYCPRSVEPWTPNSLKKGGIGGSETAVINLAKQWASKGYNVTVYNWCSTEEGNYDGVNYTNFWNFNWKDNFNILISWRYPELFDLPIKAKMNIVDMHDVMSPNDFTEKRLKNIDKVFVKTNAHKILYPNIPEEKFVVINNGITLDRFNTVLPKKEDHRMIYSSCPSRGLDYLLDAMPEIRKEVPDAELHVFYGWNTFYEIEKGNPERIKYMESLKRKSETTDGVILHGRVDQDKLAKEFAQSAIWAYPTDFYEISCITAMEAQYAEALPVTVNYGALGETIHNGVIVDGDITIPTIKQEWINEVIYYLKHPEKRKEIMSGAKEYIEQNLTWEIISDKWIKEFNETN